MAKIRWLGHSGFEVELMNKIVLVDPWLDGNPLAPMRAKDLKKADIVCATHDHKDHLGDAIEICKHIGAIFVGIHELKRLRPSRGCKRDGWN